MEDMQDGASCSLGRECRPDAITVLRRLRGDGTLARIRIAAPADRSPRHREVSTEHGDRGLRLKRLLVRHGVSVGKAGARMAADLVEAEAGDGRLFADVVADEARQAELQTAAADAVRSVAGLGGVQAASNEFRRSRLDFLTDAARAREIAGDPRWARPQPVNELHRRVANDRPHDDLLARRPPLLGNQISGADAEALLEHEVRTLDRAFELVEAYPPLEAARVRPAGGGTEPSSRRLRGLPPCPGGTDTSPQRGGGVGREPPSIETGHAPLDVLSFAPANEQGLTAASSATADRRGAAGPVRACRLAERRLGPLRLPCPSRGHEILRARRHRARPLRGRGDSGGDGPPAPVAATSAPTSEPIRSRSSTRVCGSLVLTTWPASTTRTPRPSTGLGRSQTSAGRER